IGKSYQTRGLAGVFSTFTVNVPQLEADIDRVKAKQQGVPLQNLFETMQIYLGSLYVNDFNRFGRTYQVIAQADAQFRDRAEAITRLKTRNAKGQMVPLGTLVKVKETHGPDRAMRYNGYPAAEINGGPALGYSSGQAESLIAGIAHANLPKGMKFEWTDLTYQRMLAGNSAVYIYPLCLLLVFRDARSEIRQTMGVAVFPRMTRVNLLGLFPTPVFYVTLMKLGRKKGAHDSAPANSPGVRPSSGAAIPGSTSGPGLAGP